MTINLLDSPSFLKLIAHDLRWKILSLLANSDLRVQELTEALAEPQNLVSYHLQKLLQAKLVLEHPSIADGRARYYSLDFDRMDEHLRAMGRTLNPAFSVTGEIELYSLAKVRVLFICTHNSARSQMAEGMLRAQTHNHIQVFSAGTEPTRVHPLAVQVMAEMGMDISQVDSKGVDLFVGQSFDYVITVCDRAREACAVFPGNPVQIHWSIPDPTEVMGTEVEQYAAFTAVADQVTSRTKNLLRRIAAENRG